MAVKNEGLPDLEGYLEERGCHLVTYTEGAAYKDEFREDLYDIDEDETNGNNLQIVRIK